MAKREEGVTVVEYAVILCVLFLAIALPVKWVRHNAFVHTCAISGGTVSGNVCNIPKILPVNNGYNPANECFGPQCVPGLGNGGGRVAPPSQGHDNGWNGSDGGKGHDD